jgi:LuxR family transcriptional regulator, maltose regulon positive regulatory protein
MRCAGWWRYHHLFADLLRARLQAGSPGKVPGLHRNAAAWYAERGLADNAIRHAVAAGEMTWAARLIEQHFDAAERAYAGTGEKPFEPTIDRAGSLLVNVPVMIALVRGYLAQLRGDAKATAGFGMQARAGSAEGEWILRSIAQGQLTVAGWLDGRLGEAERGFAHGIAGRRSAGLPTWGAWESYELGQVQYAQGRLDAAVRT